ncbi:MAG: hypothetical protein KF777_00255 [Planctomycetaceae bacterium]|nr:hypothetical protein [Planctomycetaceae bacterium]
MSANRTIAPTKPSRPYPTFPLGYHVTGRFSKKIKGRLFFFGRWGRVVNGQVVAFDNQNAAAATALEEFNRQWPYLAKGLPVPSADGAPAVAGCSIAEACNSFLNHRQSLVDSGELSRATFDSYIGTCNLIAGHFGRDRDVATLQPDDFAAFRAALAKGVNVVTLLSRIMRCRIVFGYASENLLDGKPVRYGSAFKRPKKKDLLVARNARDPRIFTADELRKMLDHLAGKAVKVDGKTIKGRANPVMRGMILAGLNCAFGNTDISTLTQSALDLENGWVEFARQKTGVRRRIPLWPETIEALKAAIAERPEPADPADSDRVFLNNKGGQFMQLRPSMTNPDRVSTINVIARRFDLLVTTLKIPKHRGRGFYSLRHQFETIAGECADQVSVNSVMGHSDNTMAGNYRHGVSDDRLRKAVNTVREWLWPEVAEQSR